MRKKQGILIIADGLGDRPIRKLDNKTPLEYAKTPNLDFLASRGMCGNVYPYEPGVRVGTDVGHLLIFGYDPKKVYSGRGPIEAYSGGLELLPGDIAFRGNFATVDDTFKVIDRRAQRITKGTKELAEAINGLKLDDGTTVLVKELTAHRAAIVLRGENLSANITTTDPGTAEEGKNLVRPEPLDDSEASKRTAELLWELTNKIYSILSSHSINKEREKEDKLPANMIIVRGPGKKPSMHTISEQYDLKCGCVAGDLTIHGIAKMTGMDSFMSSSFTGGFDTDVLGKARMGIKLLKEGYDWVVIHVKAPDLAGHDNLPDKKVESAEKIDGLIGLLIDNLDLDNCYISFTADHSTPCEVRDHTGDPVPTIISGGDVRKDGISQAGESYFSKGSLHNLTANDIFMLQMDLMGFTKKYGA